MTSLSDKDVIDPEAIQLTRSLIFSAICQSILEKNSLENGFADLDNHIQDLICQEYLSIQNQPEAQELALA